MKRIWAMSWECLLCVVFLCLVGPVAVLAEASNGSTDQPDTLTADIPPSELDEGGAAGGQAPLPLFLGCPRRNDSETSFLGGGFAGRELGSSSRGTSLMGLQAPGSTYGDAVAQEDFTLPPQGLGSYLQSGYQSARNDYFVLGGIRGSDDRMDVQADFGAREAGNYSAPGGTVVPAGLTARHVDLGTTWHLDPEQKLWTTFSYLQQKNIDAPSLPMDDVGTDNLAGNGGWQIQRPGSSLGQISITAGFQAVDHRLDNSRKPTVLTAPASIDGKIRNWDAHARTLLGRSGPQVTLGTDFTHQMQAFERRGVIQEGGQLRTDHLQTEATQFTGGLFSSVDFRLSGSSRLVLEGRADAVTSKSRSADSASLGHRTLVEQWIRYFGADASDYDQTEWLGAAAATVGHEFSTRTRGYLRTQYRARPAGIGQRYYGFIPTPGGYRLGNPTLGPEKEWDLATGLSWSNTDFVLTASGFLSSYSDFILPRIIDRIDVDGDGIPDDIKGYLPRDAQLYGGALGLEWRPSDRVRAPLCVKYLRGRNTTDDKDLPEIPPLSGYAELHILAHVATQTGVWAQVDFAADQNHIDPLFGEDSTPGYAIWGLGASTAPVHNLDLTLQVDNIFDRRYHNHLVREAVLPVGGLSQGQEIPAQGRNLRVAARWVF